jgi:hypothetical protein
VHFVVHPGTGPTLDSGLDAYRLTLDVLAATVRDRGEDAPRRVGQALGRLLWRLRHAGHRILEERAVDVCSASPAWKTVLFVEIGVVGPAGAAVYLHQQASSRRVTAALGGPSGRWPRWPPCAWACCWRVTRASGPSPGAEEGWGPRRSGSGRTGLT